MGSLDDPYGVACDPTTGDVYVANSNGGDIVVFNASGTELGTMGTLPKGKLGFTQGIWVDSDGSVWVDSGKTDTVYHFASWAAADPGWVPARSPGRRAGGGLRCRRHLRDRRGRRIRLRCAPQHQRGGSVRP